MNNIDSIKMGIIGCGAISERYLNIISKMPVQLIAAVDTVENVAKRFKEKYNFKIFTTNYKDIYEHVNCVIICLPNFLHSQVSIDFLQHGINVLCEKPMATNERYAKMMISAATNSKCILSIANVKRFFWTNSKINSIILNGNMGKVVSIDAEEGSIFSWPTKSGFFFDKSKSGGGVLIDIGSHLLDLILWWIGNYPSQVIYTDDNFGGVEADAEIQMTFDKGINVSAKLSRLRNLRNNCRIILTNGIIEVTSYECNNFLQIHKNGKKEIIKAPKSRSIEWFFKCMIIDFFESILTGKKSFIDPKDILYSIRLIEQCYSEARHFKFPWL